jgi:chromate transporter
MNSPSVMRLFIAFLRLGLTAFGGPAMIAHIKELAVARCKWLNESDFRDGIILCQAVPGATAMQMVAYVGLRAKGFFGAFFAFSGFALPAFTLMLALSILYERSHELPKVISLFAGLQVIVVAIVSNATYYFGRSIVKDLMNVLIAACSYVLLFYNISPFLIIIAAGLSGILLFRSTDTFETSHFVRIKDGQYLKPIALFVSLIAAGVAGLYFIDPKLCTLALLMFKIDLFAVGGGFSSVPLMLHEIVDIWGLMDNKTFMDGIALGQVTPGPIVITSTFVGYLLYGLPGAIVATMAIFTPSLLMVVGLTPTLDKLKASA